MDTRLYYEHTIISSEISANQKVNPYDFIKIMQEASMRSAQQLNVSFQDTIRDNISWVLIKKDIHFHAYPALGDRIKVLTYPAGFEKVFAYRDYKIYDAKDQLIATASSTWTLINTKTRRLERIPPNIASIQTPDEKFLPRTFDKLDTVDISDHSSTFNVHWFDVDWNQHASNSFLIKCILEGTPTSILSSKTLKRLKIQFKKESLFGDALTSSFQQKEGSGGIHVLHRDKDKATIILAESIWD